MAARRRCKRRGEARREAFSPDPIKPRPRRRTRSSVAQRQRAGHSERKGRGSYELSRAIGAIAV
jgi:hypothetical protein